MNPGVPIRPVRHYGAGQADQAAGRPAGIKPLLRFAYLADDATETPYRRSVPPASLCATWSASGVASW